MCGGSSSWNGSLWHCLARHQYLASSAGQRSRRSPSKEFSVSVLADSSSSYPFLSALWLMFLFFAFIIWIWLLITVFADIFRRRDIGGGMKAIWIIFVIIAPYLGVLIYLIAEHNGMADRSTEQMQAMQGAAGRLHQVRRRFRLLTGRPGRAGEVAARQRRDHAGRVRRPQGEGAQLEPPGLTVWPRRRCRRGRVGTAMLSPWPERS